MLSVFKKLFGKSPQPESAPKPTSPAAPATPAAATPAAKGAEAAAPGAPPADGIAVTLQAVVALMPDDLKKRLDQQLSGKEKIYVSRGDALRQLPSGSVKVPFSEIVKQSPNTFLSPEREMLAIMVNLPLQEILPHIKTLPRRSAQRLVEVPQDLAPVFGTGTEKSREVKAAPGAVTTGSRPSPPAPEDPSVHIPPPQPRPIPPPPPKPIPPPPQPAVAAAAAESFAPAPPAPLEPQAPITFKLPTPEAPKPAPASAPAPAPLRVTPAPTAAVAQPSPPPPAALTSPAPASVSAAPESALGFGDVFGQPQKKDWTPQEVVEKTASLRGVAGALITTVDGLPVAFHLPSNLSGNAVAAFVPQMYTRITQYTRDLKLGDAKHLTILVENVPLQIFKSGSIYFTALGKANENLPKPQLTAIAAALGRQSQA